MLISANHAYVMPLPKKPGDEPITDAASGLQSGIQSALAQALQNTVQAQALQGSAQAATSVSSAATRQVSEASRISDNVDEAFAKTRVTLQATDPAHVFASSDSTAMADFKDYMSKSPEERLRDSILQEMGLTDEEVQAMPPEQQKAIGEEIAQRMADKLKMANAETENV